MIPLLLGDVIEIHEQVIKATGGSDGSSVTWEDSNQQSHNPKWLLVEWTCIQHWKIRQPPSGFR